MSQPIDIEQQSSHNIQDDLNETVVLNIGGKKFEVLPSTLYQYPSTLLGTIFHPNNRHLRRPDKKGEYFFDRNGKYFTSILEFYRTGKLVIPSDVPSEVFHEELKYFKIEFEDSTKAENEDDKIMKLPREQILSYAISLIHNTSKYDVKRGLYFLKKLREVEPTNYQYRYSSAYACYRLGYNKEGVEILEEILNTDPHNPQAKSLLTLFTDNRITNVRLGIIGGVLLVIGIYGFYKIRKWYKLAHSTNQIIANARVVAADLKSALAVSQISSTQEPAVQQAFTKAIEKVEAIAPKLIEKLDHKVDALVQTVKPTAISAPVTEAVTNVLQSSDIKPISSQVFLDAVNQSIPSVSKN
ncbi:hypothetical protein DLAC_02643 [Tieghemostelium lacteum]|uniref:BTB domain-containing protein n=1 Tax=Tieghemostelium lacteum TaxID=361077 RepID=A0A152A335_TIELA|nr:hypothetical protein DLAC_02643 [Tieghemostelium lacteum]|eukprot:KYR00619.1 hypothetical protein DLAC_02643 [Tieghemostelium lacteum]